MASATSQALVADDPDLDVEQETGGQAGPCEEGADWNVVERAFLTRRSIRKFKKKQVPAHLVRRMLEVGRFAPSQGNGQPWRFVVVRDAAMIQEMEDDCVAACRKIADATDYTAHEKGSLKRTLVELVTRAVTANDPNTAHPVPMQVVRLIAAGKFTVFHRAPTVVLLLMDKRGIGVPEIDIGICGTNIVMAAESQRLGTCWVGFSKLLNQEPKWRERFGIDERFELSEAICVGFPVGTPADHVISRATHETSWFENGTKTVVW